MKKETQVWKVFESFPKNGKKEKLENTWKKRKKNNYIFSLFFKFKY